MKLIRSKGHYDYYDAIQRTDLDDSPVFIRKTEDLGCLYDMIGKHITIYEPIKIGRWKNTTHFWKDLKWYAIRFCGEFVLGIKRHKASCNHKDKLDCTDKCYIYLLGLDAITESYGYKGRAHQHLNKKHDELQEVVLSIYIDEPILLIGDRGAYITKNPILQDWGFQKWCDPYTAWHKLDRFLSNQAKDEPLPITVDDKHLAAAKGFGKKYDFRRKKHPRKNKKV